MAFPSYSTGTVSVSASGTVVTGVGTLWTAANCKPGDEILIAGREVVVMDFTDATHLVINPWQGTTVSGVAYKLIQSSPLRYNASQTMVDVSQIVAAMNTDGYYFYVSAVETVPNPSYGNEGQYAMQATTGQTWVKSGGVWVYLGIYKGLRATGGWLIGAAYFPNDIATLNGTSYICKVAHTGQMPPNGTYWQVNARVGPAPLLPIDQWLPGQPYSADPPAAFVSYNGSSYACAINHTSTASFTNDLAAGVWRLVAAQGAQGPKGDSGDVFGDFRTPGGRLSLTPGVAVTVTDVIVSTSIYYVPTTGVQVGVYDGAQMVLRTFTGLSLALDANPTHANYHQAGKNFDIFAVVVGGVLMLGTGPAWSTNTSRESLDPSAAIGFFAGSWTNAQTMSVRYGNGVGDLANFPVHQATYLGTFRTTGDGQATDAAEKRLLFNAYNRADRKLQVSDPAASWDYGANAWRQAHADPANMIEVLDGFGALVVHLLISGWGNNSSSSGRYVAVGMGIDSSTVNSARSQVNTFRAIPEFNTTIATYNGAPGLGYHQLRWLEQGNSGGGDVQTWYGTANGGNLATSGIDGHCVG